ncbi:hypothetical protein RN001_001926 [Aquatica leii]|uniref:Carbonyl reductase n=1 Tax=Aquatica leii TaxID=1421715 RepID=A0AAN7PCL8_9COLE|nr:hypothetical protein RN001_001926 [Aquatica leii]
MEVKKVAVVTGGNKGIGFAIVKGLCEKFNGNVYLTARSITNGNNAVIKLKQLGLNPIFHQLDVCDENSINTFRDYIKYTEGGVDVLINNAGIYADKLEIPIGDQAEKTINENYYSILNVCNALFPILRSNAQVINLSSSAGHLARIPSINMQAKFRDPLLTVDKLSRCMNEYVEDCKNNRYIEKGWGSSPYVVSKVGVSALSILQQNELDKETEKRNIFVNFVHPGYVDTDMTNHQGVMTIEEGAQSSIYLALGNHGLRGQYVWFNCKVVDWYGPTTPPKA